MRKIFILVLLLISFVAFSEPQEWKVGDNVTATWDKGVLTFSGTGATFGYNHTSAPFLNSIVVDSTHRIIFEKGVTTVGPNLLFSIMSRFDIIFENPHIRIEQLGFQSALGLHEITLPAECYVEEHKVFSGCYNLKDVTTYIPKPPNSVELFYRLDKSKIRLHIPEYDQTILTNTSFYSYSVANDWKDLQISTFIPGDYYQDRVFNIKVGVEINIFPQILPTSNTYKDYMRLYSDNNNMFSSGTSNRFIITAQKQGISKISVYHTLNPYACYNVVLIINDVDNDNLVGWKLCEDQYAFLDKTTKTLTFEGNSIGIGDLYTEDSIPPYSTEEYNHLIEKVVFSTNIENVGAYQCRNLVNLKYVEFNRDTIQFYNNCFDSCTSLEEIIMPKYSVFNTVKQHFFNGCTSLKRIVLYNNTIPYIMDNIFAGVELESVSVYVPNHLVNEYKTHEVMSNLNIKPLHDSIYVSLPDTVEIHLGQSHPFTVDYFSPYNTYENPYYTIDVSDDEILSINGENIITLKTGETTVNFMLNGTDYIKSTTFRVQLLNDNVTYKVYDDLLEIYGDSVLLNVDNIENKNNIRVINIGTDITQISSSVFNNFSSLKEIFLNHEELLNVIDNGKAKNINPSLIKLHVPFEILSKYLEHPFWNRFDIEGRQNYFYSIESIYILCGVSTIKVENHDEYVTCVALPGDTIKLIVNKMYGNREEYDIVLNTSNEISLPLYHIPDGSNDLTKFIVKIKRVDPVGWYEEKYSTMWNVNGNRINIYNGLEKDVNYYTGLNSYIKSNIDELVVKEGVTHFSDASLLSGIKFKNIILESNNMQEVWDNNSVDFTDYTACIYMTSYNLDILRDVKPWSFFECITPGDECVPGLKEINLWDNNSTQVKVYSDTTIHVNNSVDKIYIEITSKDYTDIVSGCDGYKYLNVGENNINIDYFSLCDENLKENVCITVIRDQPTNINSPDVTDEIICIYNILGKRIYNKPNEKIKIVKYKSGKIKKELTQ